MLTTFTVNTSVDENDGVGVGGISLRDAIRAAAASGDTIEFSTNLVNLSLGEIDFDKSLTINGGTAGVTIHAAPNSRIFNITDPSYGSSPPLVALTGLTLTGGHPDPFSDPYFGQGGAVRSEGPLTIQDSTITGNAALSGGGVFVQVLSDGTGATHQVLAIYNTTITNNQTSYDGGGVSVHSESGISFTEKAVITGSTISGNTAASGAGGGLYFRGKELSLHATTIRDNHSGYHGGGLFARATDGSILIDNQSIIEINTMTGYDGGGGGAYLYSRNSAVTITGTIISGNQALGPEANIGGLSVKAVNGSSVLIDGVKVIGNHADDDLGGFSIINSASNVTVRNSTISGNTASHNRQSSYDAAAGVWLGASSGGSNTIEYSTISDNKIITDPLDPDRVANAPGGGLFIHNDNYPGTITTIRNTTISGNHAEGSGGGVKISEIPGAGGNVSILHSTITNNRANSDNVGVETGGGIHVGNSGTTVTIEHTIVAGNFRGTGSTRDDISGTVTASWSLVGDDTGAMINDVVGNQIGNGTTPKPSGLDPTLALNGGLTETHALLAGSLAIDMGDPALRSGSGTTPLFDQRGGRYLRVTNPNTGFGAPPRIDIGAVERQPLVLRGDYNVNGTVDAGDYNIWRDLLGATRTSFVNPDGSGNGLVDIPDYDVWKANFGATAAGGAALAIALVLGDYNADGTVNTTDFNLWQTNLGSTTNLAADGNGNGIVDLADLEILQRNFMITTLDFLPGDFDLSGVVDTADYDLWAADDPTADADGDGDVDQDDYDVWEANFGLTSAAVAPYITNPGSGWPLEIPNAAPKVIGVSVGGVGLHDFATIAGSGEQLRSVPIANANSVRIRFSEEVFVTQNALTLTNLDGISPASVTSFVYDIASQTATWTYSSAFADGRHLLRLADSLIDLDHETLDGEFTNPWSLGASGSTVFPSGDGEAGGEFRFRFTVLAGDTDHNNVDGTANYQNWKSYEPGMIHVSTTADDFDGDLTFGDLSLREAIDYANTATEPTTIDLPAGRYALSLGGTEDAGTAFNDLDVFGNATILGAGAGLSDITTAWTSVPYLQMRVFDVRGAAARLRLEGITVSGSFSAATPLGAAALVQNQAKLEIVESAIVNDSGYGSGIGIQSLGSDVTILRSVFTNNTGYDGVAVQAWVQGSYAGSLTIGDSIFALNKNWSGSAVPRNVVVSSGVVKTNLGNNLYDNAAGGFFDVVPGTGDYLGTPHYVVTTVADTFDHTNNVESLSIREAVDKANTTAGVQEIWIPAWTFVLTRDRATYGGGSLTDTDIAWGDLDIKDSLKIRGVAEWTSVAWKPGIVDAVFELLGDGSHDGSVDAADYTVWQDTLGSTTDLRADGDDDGVVDADDYTIWTENFGHTLQLFDVVS